MANAEINNNMTKAYTKYYYIPWPDSQYFTEKPTENVVVDLNTNGCFVECSFADEINYSLLSL